MLGKGCAKWNRTKVLMFGGLDLMPLELAQIVGEKNQYGVTDPMHSLAWATEEKTKSSGLYFAMAKGNRASTMPFVPRIFAGGTLIDVM